MENSSGNASPVTSGEKIRSSLLSLSILTFILFSLVGLLTYQVVHGEMERLLASDLLTSLRTNQESMNLWMQGQKRLVETLAQDSIIEEGVLQLIQTARQLEFNRRALVQSDALRNLRIKLRPILEKYEMTGFVVFDETGTQVGAEYDHSIGGRKLIARSNFVSRSLQGETMVTPPFRSNIPLPDSAGTFHKDWPTMFVSTPVYENSGKVVGVLALRLSPHRNFTRVLKSTRPGETGEAYAFNGQGYLVTESRFWDQMPSARRLQQGPERGSILNVRLLEPDQASASSSEILEETQEKPFTRMADSALKGESGVDTTGYLNYRGAQVVGAWTWMEEYALGLAVEQEVSEAFSPLISIRTIYILILTMLGFVTVSVLILRARQGSLEEQKRQTQKALVFQQQQNEAIIKHALDAIITTDSGGKIQSFNPAAEKMFKYEAKQVIGKNIDLLMPEPYKSECRGYLNRYSEKGGKRVFLEGRVLPAVTREGKSFQIELTVTSMLVDDQVRFLGVLRDITERTRQSQEMERLFRHNELILSAAGEGIYGLDMEGRVTFVNPAGAGLVGYTQEELLGQFQHSLVHHTRTDGSPYPREECPIYQTMDDGQVHHHSDEVFWRKDGSSFPVEYTSKPIFEQGNVVGAVVTFRDISKRLKAEGDLRCYAEDLEKINQELLNFTSVATHDLQEPLRKVVTLADRLKVTNEPRLDDRGKGYLDRMVASVERMQHLIYDLLEYSRTTSQSHGFELVQLEEEVREVLSVLEFQIEQAGAKVEVGPLPLVEASRFQMRQLFQNLISNSLKFRKSGQEPHIILRTESKSNGTCTIVVEDQGIGFDEKYLDRIFKPFQRLHGQRDYEGSGIGLAICQKIVLRHHGTLTARSAPGQGSRFIITLPVKQQPRK